MANWLFWTIIAAEYGIAFWYVVLIVTTIYSLFSGKNGPTFAILFVSIIRFLVILIWLIPTLFILRQEEIFSLILARVPIIIAMAIAITFFMWQFYFSDWLIEWRAKRK